MKGSNEFWVVRNNETWGNSCSMYNRLPEKTAIYMGPGIPLRQAWYSYHGCCGIRESTAEKFRELTFDSEPVKVRLVRSERDIPDFYVERCGENLFIGYFLEGYWHAVPREKGFKRLFSKWKWVKAERVSHLHRISNKLFPEIKDGDGPIKMDIERIKE